MRKKVMEVTEREEIEREATEREEIEKRRECVCNVCV